MADSGGRRLPKDAILRTRCTQVTKAEVLAEARRDNRDESAMVRILVEEALAARTRDRR